MWRAGEFELVACPQLVQEVRKALTSPRLAARYDISETEAEAFARLLTEEGMMTNDPEDPPRVVPDDPNDDYLVALAASTGLLVSRDRHFDKVDAESVRIISPGEALRLLDSRSPLSRHT